jgi:hypothetical protein
VSFLDRWWVFQPRGQGRRPLTAVGVAWTLAAYILLGLGTDEAVRVVVRVFAGLAGPVLLVIAVSLGWTALRVCTDGQFLRAAAWFTGAGWGVVQRLVSESPTCGNLVFGAGLPGISPGIAPCTPHQDFMATLFIAAWALCGPVASVALSGLDLYRWLRRDPLYAYRYGGS